MAKKNKIQAKVKDPKKVAAGKARASKAFRIDGKFTTNAFVQKVKEDAEATGVKDSFDFFLQNQSVYENLYKADMLTTNKDFNTLRKDIKGYNGKIFLNGRQVKKDTVLRRINELNQYLKTEHNIVAFWEKISISLSGKMQIELPSVSSIQKQIEEGEEIDEVMENAGISVIISDPKEMKIHFVKSKRARLTICGRDKSKVQYTLTKNQTTCENCKKKM